ncbi:hypothetical protein ACIBTZ_34095 [Micromonospora sp. NPDC049460]|uniref:hypothetical protein n=1 Tax=Micromonospora sp. NPDC049460 TaxID=3364272 RepID=UPI0037AD6C90
MTGDNDRIWAALPEQVRAGVDDLICRRSKVSAAALVREGAGPAGPVSIPDALRVVEERGCELMALGRVDPPSPPVPASRLIEQARTITDPVVAIEALWDGDTARWGVLLLAIVHRPSARHPQFDEQELTFVDGRDAPAFTGTVPHMPAAAEATHKGSAVAHDLAVPFSFLDPEASLVDPPRWWDSQPA